MQVCRFVNSVFQSNTYVLTGEGCKDACLVDAGDVEPVERFLRSHGLRLVSIFLTHCHYDHIYGVQRLLADFPACCVYTSVFGRTALADARLNFSRYHGDPLCIAGGQVRVLEEGDTCLLFPGVQMEVFATPGHDESCLTYRADGCVFSGDSYIPGQKVIATFPHSSKAAAESSRRRILALADGCGLYPGHGASYPVFSRAQGESCVYCP